MLKFTEPEYQTAQHMASLTTSDSLEGYYGGKTSYPPKQPRDILDLIRQGNTNEISLVEWNRFIAVSDIWKEIKQSVDVDDVILAVFAEAEVNAGFRQLVMLKAVLTMEHSEEMLPTLLFSHLPILSNSLNGIDSERFSFLVLFSQEDTKSIAQLLFQQCILPRQLLSKYGWPTYTCLLTTVENFFVRHLADFNWWSDEKYLLTSLKSLSTANQIELVEYLLKVLPTGSIGQEIKKWIVSKSSPEGGDSFWGKLSSFAKEVLVKRFDFSLFPIHRQIVNRFIGENKSTLDRDDINVSKRMKNRLDFWSNYSERVLNSRLLVPNGEAYPINTTGAGLKVINVEPLDPNEPTEILILEFEGIVILDQLRPTGAAIRIFKSDYSSASTLLHQPIYKEKDVLILHQDDIHDHAYLWQWSLESLLRQTYQLLPNPGLVRFNSLGNKFNRYIHGKGLSTPDKQARNDRTDKLEAWTASFMRIERLLGKYEGLESVKENLQRNRIRILKIIDQGSEYVQALRKEAEADHHWAMEELAHYLLTKPSASYEQRMEGEKWLEAAKK